MRSWIEANGIVAFQEQCTADDGADELEAVSRWSRDRLGVREGVARLRERRKFFIGNYSTMSQVSQGSNPVAKWRC